MVLKALRHQQHRAHTLLARCSAMQHQQSRRLGGGGRGGGGRGGGGGGRGGTRSLLQRPKPRPRGDDGGYGGSAPNVEGAYEFVATCHPGLEGAVAAELSSPRIGAVQVEPAAGGGGGQTGRVSFWAREPAAACRAALWLRAATRVLQPIAAADLDPYGAAGDTVYEAARELIDWPALLPRGGALGVTAQVWSCANVANSQLVARRVRDAACDAVRDATGARPPPPDERGPQLPLHAALVRDRLTLYRDFGGGSLHRRGYRADAAVHRAALNEAAAAGLLLTAGWGELCRADDAAVIADPTCGSGTFLIEAAAIAEDLAPGLLRAPAAGGGAAPRRWPFEAWHDFDARAWRAALEEARAARRPWRGAALGNDVHAGALSLARACAEAAGVARAVELHRGDCARWRLAGPPTLVVANPPWGQRIGGDGGGDDDRGSRDRDRGGGGGERFRPSEALATWRSLGAFLRASCPGTTAWVLSGAPELTTELGMRAWKKRKIKLGGVGAAWLAYDVLPPREDGGGGGDDGEAADGGGQAAGQRRHRSSSSIASEGGAPRRRQP